MKNAWILLLAMSLLVVTVVAIDCADDDDDDDNNDADDDDDDDDDDTGGDDDTYTDPVDRINDNYPDNLSVCQGYDEAPVWFAYDQDDAYHAQLDFYDAFGVNFAPGSVTLDGDEVELSAGDWQLTVDWLASDVTPPFDTDQDVWVFFGPYDGYESPAPLLWVLDDAGETLLFQDTTAGDRIEQVGEHSYLIVNDIDCEYFADLSGVPPESYWGPWNRVVGRGFAGSIDGHVFDIWANQSDVVSLDGFLAVHMPYNYEGSVETDENPTDIDPNYHAARLVQILRAD